MDEAARAAWYSLEDDDPLSQRSRFHRTRVATLDDDRPLVDVLRTLHSENRRNVLVIPAAFCVDSATMRAMQSSVRELEDVMTIQWQPGLGATLAR